MLTKYCLILLTKETCQLQNSSPKQDIEFSFFLRTLNEWNSLPKDLVHSQSVDSFKSKLINSF